MVHRPNGTPRWYALQALGPALEALGGFLKAVGLPPVLGGSFLESLYLEIQALGGAEFFRRQLAQLPWPHGHRVTLPGNVVLGQRRPD